MRRCFITGFVALAPLAGVMLFAVRDSRGQQPTPPSKNAAPKDVAPRNEPQPPQAQIPRPNDRDISPREQNPAQRDRDAVRERDASHDRDATREREPGDVARQPGAKEERPEGNRETQRERRSDRDLGVNFGRVTDRGLAVNNLTSNSALVRAGLRAGDVIVSVGGHRLERAEDFDRFVYETGTTDRIKVIVFRGGREEVVYLEPTIFYAEPSYVDDFSYFGVVLDDHNPDRLIVQRVYPDSPAFIAGIRIGDEITTFHGKRVGNRAELARMLHGIEPGKVDLEFSHNGRVVRSEAKFNERVAARSHERGPK